MRRAARTDANQKKIVEALREAGCTVAVTSHVGDGFPDLVVGLRMRNYLLEIKDENQPPSKQALTDKEAAFHAKWRGEVVVVRNVEEAIDAVSRR